MKDTPSCDIALIHPPQIFHREKYAIFPLPWNLSHVGSTSHVGRYPVGPNWVEEPLGLHCIKDFIERNSDYVVNIHNLACLKLLPKHISEIIKHLQKKDARILTDFERTKDVSLLTDLYDRFYPDRITHILKNLRADLFAVNLHWLVYSQGAIQTLKLLKQFHPQSYTVAGGITASYFKDEIMNMFPFIDFLIVGDGCLPLIKLLKQIKGQKKFSKVPNLLYREKGKIKRGAEGSLNDFKYIQSDDKVYLGSIQTARGCPLQCITCGGSKYASKNIFNYSRIRAYSVNSIMEKLFCLSVNSKKRPTVFLIHDPFLTLGREKWEFLLEGIKKCGLNISFHIEFFLPHTKEDILNIAEKIPGSTIHISPESMDVGVRSFHKNLRYSNEELIMNMDLINDIDDLAMEVWFMAGLAKETKESVDSTLLFIKQYYKKINRAEENFIKYNEMLFIDPGSLAFDFPNKYGYRLINRSFLSHVESFEMPIFKYQINYRTRHHTRDQLFDLFLYMHDQMNRIYYENNVIDRRLYDRVMLYNKLLKKYAAKYDRALLEKDKLIRNKCFEKIGDRFRRELEE